MTQLKLFEILKAFRSNPKFVSGRYAISKGGRPEEAGKGKEGGGEERGGGGGEGDRLLFPQII